MRIRSIHPEFWRSEDVGALSWDARLVFIGLWSYVDDNGVGRDVERLIIADLFPLEEDPRETLATVSGALATLSSGGQITRYTVAGKPLLHITAWDKWQRIDKPGKSRYEPPTCEDAVIRDTLATPSRDTPETPAPGEGEKGRRGEVTTLPDESGEPNRFEEFWDTYGKKVDRALSEKRWATALKKPGVTADLLIAAAAAYVRHERAENQGGRFIMDASRWLLNERWTDETPRVQATVTRLPRFDELEEPPSGLSPAEYAAWDQAQREKRQGRS